MIFERLLELYRFMQRTLVVSSHIENKENAHLYMFSRLELQSE